MTNHKFKTVTVDVQNQFLIIQTLTNQTMRCLVLFSIFPVLVLSHNQFCGEIVDESFSNSEFRSGESYGITDLPWMASFGFYDKNGSWNHLCSSSLITTKHLLTSADCGSFFQNSNGIFYESFVRLGTDNMSNPGKEMTDFKVKEFKKHPNLDLAIIILIEPVEFSTHIRPICLPLTPTYDPDHMKGELVYLSAWEANSIKLYSLQVNSYEDCMNETQFIIERSGFLKDFQNSLACLGDDWTDNFQCKKIDGGPIFTRVINSARKRPFFQQKFIIGSLKNTYIRLSSRPVLSWIQKHADLNPILMVVGGYNTDLGFLDSIELVSLTKRCLKQVPPVPGPGFMGHFGAFTNDAPLICGGYNQYGDQDQCYQLNLENNRSWSASSCRFFFVVVFIWIVKIQSKCSQNSVKIQSKYSRISVEIQSKFSQNSVISGSAHRLRFSVLFDQISQKFSKVYIKFA